MRIVGLIQPKLEKEEIKEPVIKEKEDSKEPVIKEEIKLEKKSK